MLAVVLVGLYRAWGEWYLFAFIVVIAVSAVPPLLLVLRRLRKKG